MVENLRLDVGRDPDDRGAAELAAELSARSGEFRQWWAEHRVYQRTFGAKRLRHPVVGELTVDCDALDLVEQDQHLVLYSAPRGSSGADALALLGVLGAESVPSPR